MYAMTIERPMINLVGLIPFLVLLIDAAMADPETNPVWQDCGNTTFSNSSAFRANLNRVLEMLVENVYWNGFNTSDWGRDSNRVYGLIQCRGDLDSSECKQCASEAKANLLEGCGHNATSGLIQLDGCFLRYDNYRFFSNYDGRQNGKTIRLCNTGNSTDPRRFTESIRRLLSNITLRAAQSPRLFAADSAAGVSTEGSNIYGIAQCWRDLSMTSCGSCLTFADEQIFLCPNYGALGAQFATRNCYLRYEVYPFFNTSILSASSSPGGLQGSAESGGRGPAAIIIGAVVAALAVSVGIIGLCKRKLLASVLRTRLCQNRGQRPEINCEDLGEENLSPGSLPLNSRLNFNYDVLRVATGNFLAENKLGEGGFGSVYRGILPDGKEVAVKRLHAGSRRGDAEFVNEANLISGVQHRNLVKLEGCCAQSSQRLLVYEYLPNGSLDKILFDPAKRHSLDWNTRHNIILGTARGLAYLHEESEVRIIHRDIKASNILLGDRFRPKVADFGLARLFAEDESHVSTRVAGTLGYMAPEYALHGQLTEKADVFSFGVLVLEIVSGIKNQDLSEDMQFLIEKAWRLYEINNVWEMIDPLLRGRCPVGAAARAVHVALLCCQGSATLRPTMSRVVSMLTSSSEQDQHLPLPAQPAFIDSGNVLALRRRPSQGKTLNTSWAYRAAATSSTNCSTCYVAEPSSSSFFPEMKLYN